MNTHTHHTHAHMNASQSMNETFSTDIIHNVQSLIEVHSNGSEGGNDEDSDSTDGFDDIDGGVE